VGTFNSHRDEISKSFGWQNQFADIYVSNPANGGEKERPCHHDGLEYRLRTKIGRSTKKWVPILASFARSGAFVGALYAALPDEGVRGSTKRA